MRSIEVRTSSPGRPEEDLAKREEIFTAWHDEHKRDCPNCVIDGDGSMESACAEYHLIRLLYTALEKL